MISRIREEAQRIGRSIDPDHFGAGFSFRFGSWDDPVVQATAGALSRFTKDLEPKRYIAAGGASDILAPLRSR